MQEKAESLNSNASLTLNEGEREDGWMETS